MFTYAELVRALWFILPAYIANASPPLLRGRHPIDFKKKLKKARILGDGKTIEGAIGGIVFGCLCGLIQMYFFSDFQSFFGLTLIPPTYSVIFLLSSGAVVGDIAGSFLKRRFRIDRRRPAPLLDQLDFLVGALVFVSIVYKLSSVNILILVIITPILHWLTNLFAYYSRIKDVPW